MNIQEAKLVSKDLQKILDGIHRQQVIDRRDEVSELLQDDALPEALGSCTWWDGCYYCRDKAGNWHHVCCVA